MKKTLCLLFALLLLFAAAACALERPERIPVIGESGSPSAPDPQPASDSQSAQPAALVPTGNENFNTGGFVASDGDRSYFITHLGELRENVIVALGSSIDAEPEILYHTSGEIPLVKLFVTNDRVWFLRGCNIYDRIEINEKADLCWVSKDGKDSGTARNFDLNLTKEERINSVFSDGRYLYFMMSTENGPSYYRYDPEAERGEVFDAQRFVGADELCFIIAIDGDRIYYVRIDRSFESCHNRICYSALDRPEEHGICDIDALEFVKLINKGQMCAVVSGGYLFLSAKEPEVMSIELETGNKRYIVSSDETIADTFTYAVYGDTVYYFTRGGDLKASSGNGESRVLIRDDGRKETDGYQRKKVLPQYGNGWVYYYRDDMLRYCSRVRVDGTLFPDYPIMWEYED